MPAGVVSALATLINAELVRVCSFYCKNAAA